MRASIQAVLDQYQVRKTDKQKRAFIAFMKNHAQEHGYQLEEQPYKRRHGKNLMVGNPETAQLIVTAHYDTPSSALIPIVTVVGNLPIYVMSHFLIFLPALVIFRILQLLVTTIFGDIGVLAAPILFLGFEIPLFVFIMLILWYFQMMMGFANKNNANDNTSGVSVLLSLLEDLPRDQRNKVCFVFFDEEEKGLEGSKFFKRLYYKEVRFKPLINFDCVGHGKHLIFIRKKEFRTSPFNQLLVETIKGKALIKEASHCVYPSDQLIFKQGVAVAAVHRAPILGYYLSRLHSPFDHRFSTDNIEVLNQIMINFIEKI